MFPYSLTPFFFGRDDTTAGSCSLEEIFRKPATLWISWFLPSSSYYIASSNFHAICLCKCLVLLGRYKSFCCGALWVWRFGLRLGKRVCCPLWQELTRLTLEGGRISWELRSTLMGSSPWLRYCLANLWLVRRRECFLVWLKRRIDHGRSSQWLAFSAISSPILLLLWIEDRHKLRTRGDFAFHVGLS